MQVNVASEAAHAEETLCSLQFGARLALVQTSASIALTLAALPPNAGDRWQNAWILVTLGRVGAGCALTLTALWPNKLSRQPLPSDDFLQPPPGAPSLHSPMARALLQQVGHGS